MESRKNLHPRWCGPGSRESGQGRKGLQHGFHGSHRTIDDTITTARGTTTTNLLGPSFIDTISTVDLPLTSSAHIIFAFKAQGGPIVASTGHPSEVSVGIYEEASGTGMEIEELEETQEQAFSNDLGFGSPRIRIN
jgi:hypothetical protein